MKTLTVLDEVLQADTIVKTATAVFGYIQGKEVFAFQGVNDFSSFALAEGEKFDIPIADEIAQLREKVQQLEQEMGELRNADAVTSES